MITYFIFIRIKFKKSKSTDMFNDKILSSLNNNRIFQSNENKFLSR